MRAICWRRIGIVVAASVLAAVPASGQAGAQPEVSVQPSLPFPIPPVPPEFDAAFYAPPPSTYADKMPGEIIAARQVNVANFSVVPINVDAWQLSYRTTDTRGEPMAAVTTVLKPRGEARGGPRKLVSFQMGEDSLAQYCAPSYGMQLASIPGQITGSPVVSAEFLEVQALLTQGWAVSVPDHEGPNSAYAAGPLAGRITLDGVRAAENFAPLGLPGTDTRVGLWGYSGGAIATGHAAELHPTYAPELNVVGVAEGGTPADLGAVLLNSVNNAPSGLTLAAVMGLGREYPDFQQFLEEEMNPLGQALMAIKNPLCLTYQALTLPFANNTGLLNVEGDVLAHPAVVSVLERTRMGRTVPTAPMFIYQANPDWLVPVGQVNTLVDDYCRDPNARVLYTRDHFSEHVSLPVVAAPAAILWMKDRLDGVAVEPGCVTRDAGSMALDQATWPAFVATVGELLAGLFGKPLGN